MGSGDTMNPVTVVMIGTQPPGFQATTTTQASQPTATLTSSPEESVKTCFEPPHSNDCNAMDTHSVNQYQFDIPICRICHCGDGDSDSLYKGSGKQNSTLPLSTTSNDCSASITSSSPISEMTLITPCCCAGSLRYVHHSCLQQWIRSSNNKYCELCKYHFKMSVKYKPLHKWERLEMSSSERRKLLYNLLFNLISMFCVFWSIYVLIERATFEAKYGLLDWPFWTKMLVVSIGFLGGTIFLFVQLRLYLSIFMRWRQYNRIIIIHSVNCDNNTKVPRLEKKASFELDLSGIK